MFTDSQKLSNALMKMLGCITNIICITQITCKSINNAILTYNTWLNFFWLKIMLQFFVRKIGCKVVAILLLRSCNCLRTALLGKCVRTVGQLSVEKQSENYIVLFEWLCKYLYNVSTAFYF